MCIAMVVAVAAAIPSHAFLTPSPTSSVSSTSRLQMIGNIFGGGDENNDPQLPKDVKDAISKCRGAVQQGLENRLSRMVRGSMNAHCSFSLLFL